jgi:hypothetical protein
MNVNLTLILTPLYTCLLCGLHACVRTDSERLSLCASKRPCFVDCTASGEFTMICCAVARAVEITSDAGTTVLTLCG